jgi:hypothetical protein
MRIDEDLDMASESEEDQQMQIVEKIKNKKVGKTKAIKKNI